MRKLLILSVAALAITACKAKTDTTETVLTETAEITETTRDQNVEITQWFEARFMDGVKRSPMMLAQIGMKERMDEWDDPSREYALEQIQYYKDGLSNLQATFDRDQLNASNQLSYDLMERFLVNQIEDDKWWDYGYSFNQMFGAQSRLPTFMKNQHRIDNVDDANAYIARLNGIKNFLGTIINSSQKSAKMGIMAPKFVYDHVIRDTNNVIQGAPFDDSGSDNVFLDDFKTKIGKLELSDEERDGLVAQATEALLTSVGPTYQNLIEVMQEQQGKTTTEDGAWKLPNGAEYYAYRLNRMTTTDMTATEIHDLGLSEVARIHGEMRDIMEKVGFEGTLQEFFEDLRVNPKFYYEDSDAGRDAYLAEATVMIDTMKGKLDDYFLTKPKADLDVRKVEAFREKSAGKAFYNRPALDGSRPGIYYANLYKITDMPKYQMEALAYHEGIPGHHMQFALTQEMDIPKFQRFGSATAHTEGWGLYSEYLPKEMGFYEDPYSDFGRLAMELWRAARLVVDTGLHDKKWTRQEAIDYLVTNTPNPENDCIKAIERYIVMPGQATAYKIGMIKILDLREMAKNKLGDKFDIREYHDVVLGAGPVPLDVLEQRVNTWVESKS